jgi:hypothetical protein
VAGVLGLSSIQKCKSALRILAYGVSPDALDEYCRMGESTAMEAMKQYVKAIRAVFKVTYLLQPIRDDLVRQMGINVERGNFLACLHL